MTGNACEGATTTRDELVPTRRWSAVLQHRRELEPATGALEGSRNILDTRSPRSDGCAVAKKSFAALRILRPKRGSAGRARSEDPAMPRRLLRMGLRVRTSSSSAAAAPGLEADCGARWAHRSGLSCRDSLGLL